MVKEKQLKSKKTTIIILALFLGGFGAHRFYLKNKGLGVVMILFCYTLIPAIIGFIGFLIYHQ